MDAEREADTPAPAELARWRADVRLRVLARPAPTPVRAPWPVWSSLCAALLLLALFGRPPVAPRPSETVGLQVMLLDAPVAPAEPPLAVPPPPRELPPRPVAPASAVGPVASEVSASPEPAAPPVPPHVFNPDGSIDLPREPVSRNDALVASFSAPPRSAEAQRIMTHQRPLKVRPNHFAANFRAPSGSALTDFVEDHLTASAQFTLPWGTHVECKGVGLGVAWLGACGWYTPYKYYVPQAPWRPASVLDEQ